MADSESKPVGYGFEVQKRADGEEREPETVCELWTNIYRKGKLDGRSGWLPMRGLGPFHHRRQPGRRLSCWGRRGTIKRTIGLLRFRTGHRRN